MIDYLKKIYLLYGKYIPQESNIVFSYGRDNPFYDEYITIRPRGTLGLSYDARDDNYLEFDIRLPHTSITKKDKNIRQYTFTDKFINEIMNGEK